MGQTGNNVIDDVSPLRRFIAPLDVADFWSAYWCQKPLAQKRGTNGVGFKDLISLEEFDDCLAYGYLQPPFAKIVKEGVKLSPVTRAPQRQEKRETGKAAVDLNEIYDNYSNGASIVLQAANLYLSKPAAFCREFEKEINCPVRMNISLSPPLSSEQLVRCDAYAVFITQIEGAKTFNIWNDLPMKTDLLKADHEQATLPLLSVTIEAGDSLYIPPGFIYQEITGRSHSLQISAQAQIVKWLELFSLMSESVLTEFREDPMCGKALPAGYSFGASPSPQDMGCFNDLMDEFFSRLKAAPAREFAERHLSRSMSPPSLGHIQDLNRLFSEGLSVSVIRRWSGPVFLRMEDNQVVLTVNGAAESFKLSCLEGLRFILDKTAFVVSEIPCAADQDKMEIVRRLTVLGILSPTP
jgi:cupin superfamily protein